MAAITAGTLLASVLLFACSGGVGAGANDRAREQGGAGEGASGASLGAGEGGGSGSGATSGRAGQGGQAGTGRVDCAVANVGLRRLYRLTPAQLDNTVRDLTGLEGNYRNALPADTVVLGLSNHADALLVTPLFADKLRDAAEAIAAQVSLDRLAPCARASLDTACVRDVIERFGKRAFRKPLDAEDVERYARLAATEASPEDGLRLVVTAMLQSPHFLYRRELGRPESGDRYVLDDFEIASELSYALWNTLPDDALFSSAERGELHTPEQIQSAVSRMLGSPLLAQTVRDFVLEWLGLTAIPTVPKDPQQFPELTIELRAAMLAEVEHFVTRALSEHDGSLRELLTGTGTVLDARLAEHYGLDPSGLATNAQGLHEAMLEGQERSGILTLAGTLVVHARSNDSSPVHRGRLVRERLLCQIPPPPPPGVVVQPPPMDPEKTARERYAAHSELQPCAGCHVLMDPIGFAFERFDGIGRYRETENGMDIDVSGEVLLTRNTDGEFEGTIELAEKLAESSDVRACYAQKWLRYAYGLGESQADRCVLDPLVASLEGSDVTLSSLLAATTSTEQLRVRRRSPEAEAGEGGQAGNSGDSAGNGSAGDGSAGDGSAGMDEPEPPDPVLGLELTVNNDYGSGYCHTYRVTNHGAAPLTWEVALELDGTLMQNWESEVDGQTGAVTFRGTTHNQTLEPGASTQFGFCVTR